MKNVIIFFAMTFGLFSCMKNDGISDSNSQVQVMYRESNLNLGDIGYLHLNEGELHNQFAVLIIENWAICSNDPDDIANEIKRILNDYAQVIVQENNMDYGEFKNILQSIDFSRVVDESNSSSLGKSNYWDAYNFSSTIKAKLAGLLSLIENIEFDDVTSNPSLTCQYYENIIRNYYEENKGNLSTQELIYFGAMFDVAIHSLRLWSDSEFGGENKYLAFRQVIDKNCNYNVVHLRKINWGKVFGIDAVMTVAGAMTSVINSGGATAVPNPALGGIPTAGVVGVITGVAGSAVSVISQY